jgi:hypothetical protein
MKECPKLNDLAMDTVKLNTDISFKNKQDTISFILKEFIYTNESKAESSFLNHVECHSGFYIRYSFLDKSLNYYLKRKEEKNVDLSIMFKKSRYDRNISLDDWKSKQQYIFKEKDDEINDNSCIDEMTINNGIILSIEYQNRIWTRIEED